MTELDDDFSVYGEIEHFREVLRQTFPAPATPEAASRFLLMAHVALGPLLELAADPQTVDWYLPNTIDAVQRAAAAVKEALDELESVIDDVGTIQPGTPFEPAEGPVRGLLP